MMLRNTGDTLKDLFNQAKIQTLFSPEPTTPVPDKKSQDTKISPVLDAKSQKTPDVSTKSEDESPPKENKIVDELEDAMNDSHKDTNDAWVQTMYRQLQKQIHPDKNKHVAKEATRIHNAMEKEDIVAALYSHYVYHDHCPIPNTQIDIVYEKIRDEYLRLRADFDNKPPDVILKSHPRMWNDIFKQCVIKS